MVGKLAGVTVISQDGRPGAEISIRVRGGGSISQSNEPLYVVDGFPVSSLSDIPGDQIENITVLKDASSTAIYGARGANGVILVTTKGAKAGKLTVTYNGYVQSNNPTKEPEIWGHRPRPNHEGSLRIGLASGSGTCAEGVESETNRSDAIVTGTWATTRLGR